MQHKYRPAQWQPPPVAAFILQEIKSQFLASLPHLVVMLVALTLQSFVVPMGSAKILDDAGDDLSERIKYLAAYQVLAVACNALQRRLSEGRAHAQRSTPPLREEVDTKLPKDAQPALEAKLAEVKAEAHGLAQRLERRAREQAEGAAEAEGTQERRVERAIGFDARRAASAGLGRETREVGDAAGVRAGVGANAQERRVEKALGFLPARGARRRL